MRLIYLASPFTNPNPSVRQNRRLAAAGVLAYYAKPEAELSLYSSIVHWGYVEEFYSVPQEFEYWKNQDFFMINKSHALWVLPLEGWLKSYGVRLEIEYAKDLQRPIFYIQANHHGLYLCASDEIEYNSIEEYPPLQFSGWVRNALARTQSENPLGMEGP